MDRYGLRALVRQAAGRLAAAGVTSPQVDARILAEHLLGRALLLADGADGDFPAAYDALVLRRECREPLQHIIGRMWLRGAELISRPGVFIVRPETEVVAGAAIEAAREVMDGGGGVVLTADLCTGSGAIALAVATESPRTEVWAVEKEPDPFALACLNRDRVGARCLHLERGDATLPATLDFLDGLVDVVVTNPPYVPADEMPTQPEAAADPHAAIYGGSADGTEIPVRIMLRARSLLRPGGWLLMEHSPTQERVMREHAARVGMEEIDTVADLAGRKRFLRARAPKSARPSASVTQ